MPDCPSVCCRHTTSIKAAIILVVSGFFIFWGVAKPPCIHTFVFMYVCCMYVCGNIDSTLVISECVFVLYANCIHVNFINIYTAIFDGFYQPLLLRLLLLQKRNLLKVVVIGVFVCLYNHTQRNTYTFI